VTDWLTYIPPQWAPVEPEMMLAYVEDDDLKSFFYMSRTGWWTVDENGTAKNLSILGC
jgi:hypothetical protein